MTLPFTLPDWLPGWALLAILLPAVLYALALLAMPLSILGLRGRLERLDARLDEIQGEIRSLSLRLPEPGRRPADAARASHVAYDLPVIPPRPSQLRPDQLRPDQMRPDQAEPSPASYASPAAAQGYSPAPPRPAPAVMRPPITEPIREERAPPSFQPPPHPPAHTPVPPPTVTLAGAAPAPQAPIRRIIPSRLPPTRQDDTGTIRYDGRSEPRVSWPPE